MFKKQSDNIFVDAVLRFGSKTEPSMVDIMSTEHLLVQYEREYLSQCRDIHVPVHLQLVLKNYLYNNKRGKRLSVFARTMCNLNKIGIILTVDATGNIVFVNDDKYCNTDARYKELFHQTSEEVLLPDEYATFYIGDTFNKQEIERRFWITVFGIAHECHWWGFYGFNFI